MQIALSHLSLFATGPYECPYLPDKQARAQVISPPSLVTTEVYSVLIEEGFRRSGVFAYRPCCDRCQACTGVRIPAAHFRPNRSQRRTIGRYRLLTCRVLPLQFDHEHFQLYRRYQVVRHRGGGMDRDDQEQYEQFLLRSEIDSVLLEFRLDGNVVIVALTDIFAQGLSAVYTFFDPDIKGLGIFSILSQIALTQALNKDHLYLGYWIANSPKMAYKTDFQPMEFLTDGRWLFRPHDPTPGTNESPRVTALNAAVLDRLVLEVAQALDKSNSR